MKPSMLLFKSLLLSVCMVCFQLAYAAPTILIYKITNGGKEIGEIKVTRDQHGTQLVYDTETKMSIRILLKQEIQASIHSIYQNGVLQNSNAKTLLNGDVHNKCQAARKGNGYEVIHDSKMTKVISPITYSGVMIYFKEPPDGSSVFSEMNGRVNQMKKIAPQHYKLIGTKKGKDNLYWYKNGVLQRAILYHSLLDIEIERIK